MLFAVAEQCPGLTREHRAGLDRHVLATDAVRLTQSKRDAPAPLSALADLGARVSLIAAGHTVGMLPSLLWPDDSHPVELSDLPGAPVREIFAASPPPQLVDSCASPQMR
ncbi:MAG: hypothetical protein QM677_02690 [Microbacterium sp.]